MPIIKSAKKRVRIAKKATARNTKTKRSFRDAIKAFQSAVGSGKDSKKSQSKAQSSIDKAVKKGVLHKNTAARKKSQLAKKAKAAAGTKAPAKKAVAKKAPAKKPVAKKAPAKKTTKK